MELAATHGFDLARTLGSAADGERAAQKLKTAEGNLLREKIGEVVGQLFYGTLMKQMQESGFKTDLLRGGRGEEVFQGQLRMELAIRAGRAPNNALADHIYQAYIARHPSAAPQKATAKDEPTTDAKTTKTAALNSTDKHDVSGASDPAGAAATSRASDTTGAAAIAAVSGAYAGSGGSTVSRVADGTAPSTLRETA